MFTNFTKATACPNSWPGSAKQSTRISSELCVGLCDDEKEIEIFGGHNVTQARQDGAAALSFLTMRVVLDYSFKTVRGMRAQKRANGEKKELGVRRPKTRNKEQDVIQC